MAERLVFISSGDMDKPFYVEKAISFTYFTGFAVSQKQKSIRSLHENAIKEDPGLRVLEISTKSEDPIGAHLSAFNLRLYDNITGRSYPLENVFQASKMFEGGGPFIDLLEVSPREAKKDTRLHNSGRLVCFKWHDWECALEPKTMFYDWLYCKALSEEKNLTDALISGGYNAFTDIEFNQNKSINCQARAAAIFVSLYKRGLLSEYLNNKETWAEVYKPVEDKPHLLQMTLEDLL